MKRRNRPAKDLNLSPFRALWYGMSMDERFNFAEDSGVSYNYMKNRLIRLPPNINPRIHNLQSIIDASDGRINMLDMFRHFYPDVLKTLAGQMQEEALEEAKGWDRGAAA